MLEKAEEKLSTVSTDPQLREIALERERREIAHRLTLTSAWDEGHEQGVAEGRAEGRAEGKAEGRSEGEAKGIAKGEHLLLKKQLKRKFGPLSEEMQKCLEAASEGELTLWAERILTTESIEEVFGQ